MFNQKCRHGKQTITRHFILVNYSLFHIILVSCASSKGPNQILKQLDFIFLVVSVYTHGSGICRIESWSSVRRPFSITMLSFCKNSVNNTSRTSHVSSLTVKVAGFTSRERVLRACTARQHRQKTNKQKHIQSRLKLLKMMQHTYKPNFFSAFYTSRMA